MQAGLAIAMGRAVLVAALQAPGAPPAACPDVEVVWADVAGLVGRERIPAPAARPTVTLEDLGDRYRVTVAGRAHDYADAARDCERRAQVAAVFVGLTLWPLEISAPAPVPPAPPAARGPAIELGLAPWLGVAAASGQDSVVRAGGISLRAAVMGARFGVVAGVGADLPLAVDLLGVSVDERRFPLDLGARLRTGGERVGLSLDAGLAATLVRAGPSHGASSTPSSTSSSTSSATWLDPGVRVGGNLELHAPRRAAPASASVAMGVFLGAFAEISPFPRRLAFAPDGVVGRASSLRAGGLVGVSLWIR